MCAGYPKWFLAYEHLPFNTNSKAPSYLVFVIPPDTIALYPGPDVLDVDDDLAALAAAAAAVAAAVFPPPRPLTFVTFLLAFGKLEG